MIRTKSKGYLIRPQITVKFSNAGAKWESAGMEKTDSRHCKRGRIDRIQWWYARSKSEKCDV